MVDDFPLQLKSTIDKLMADKVASLLGTYPTLQWAEVDDMAQTDSIFKSDEPALIWQFSTLEPEPKAPMFRLEFTVGAKTTLDPGNYQLIRLLGEIRSVFPAEETLIIRDYTALASGPAATVDKGFFMVTRNEIEPQLFDRQSGIRYASVLARAVRYG